MGTRALQPSRCSLAIRAMVALTVTVVPLGACLSASAAVPLGRIIESSASVARYHPAQGAALDLTVPTAISGARVVKSAPQLFARAGGERTAVAVGASANETRAADGSINPALALHWQRGPELARAAHSWRGDLVVRFLSPSGGDTPESALLRQPAHLRALE